jgi:hypothetical protein
MYSVDLDPYAYYTTQPFPGVRTVGWLDGSTPFTVGRTPTDIIEKLREIMRGRSEVNVHVNQIRGIHPCHICGKRLAASDDRELLIGSSEVWIPDGAEGYFASPSMIIHYITKHKYLPPVEFLKSIEIFDLRRPFNAQAEYERLCAAMGHFVTGLIARPAVLEAFSREHSLHWPVALVGGLAILPLRKIDLDSFQASDERGWRPPILSKRLPDELRRSSHQGPLIYFETKYFCGVGDQVAALFQNGELIYGPNWAKIGPINHTLKLLGISVEPPAQDEFETVGLHLHRDTEGWLKQP